MSSFTEHIATTYEAKRSELALLRRVLHRLASHPLLLSCPPSSRSRVLMSPSLIQQDHEFSRSAFWNQQIGRGLRYLLQRVSCPTSAYYDFMAYFQYDILPLLGPTPQEFKTRGMKPCTFFSDDHTPMELIWTVDADGKMSIRFAMEPLSSEDGTPSPASVWVRSIQKLRTWNRTKAWSLEWTDICRQTLIFDSIDGGGGAEYPSQFFLGGDFSHDSMVGKFYFLPHLRATETKVAPEELVTECVSRIGLSGPWARVLAFMRTVPKNMRPVPDMVAVDCVPSAQNRIKVYFRSDATTLEEVTRIVRLGGVLDDDPLIKETTDLIERLWSLFFPGVGRYEHIRPSRPKKAAHGFLIYFEMRLGSDRLWPKVYFPVRHYCESDAFIAKAISQFYAATNEQFSRRYLNDMQNVFQHRDLSSRTGIHTYVGCCIRNGGPQLSMYMSPEVFAPERNQQLVHEN